MCKNYQLSQVNESEADESSQFLAEGGDALDAAEEEERNQAQIFLFFFLVMIDLMAARTKGKGVLVLSQNKMAGNTEIGDRLARARFCITKI